MQYCARADVSREPLRLAPRFRARFQAVCSANCSELRSNLRCDAAADRTARSGIARAQRRFKRIA
eukprot:573891-Lingulodinium_polyedra.AAC.1